MFKFNNRNCIIAILTSIYPHAVDWTFYKKLDIDNAAFVIKGLILLKKTFALYHF